MFAIWGLCEKLFCCFVCVLFPLPFPYSFPFLRTDGLAPWEVTVTNIIQLSLIVCFFYYVIAFALYFLHFFYSNAHDMVQFGGEMEECENQNLSLVEG